jgi:hypothetical protein
MPTMLGPCFWFTAKRSDEFWDLYEKPPRLRTALTKDQWDDYTTVAEKALDEGRDFVLELTERVCRKLRQVGLRPDHTSRDSTTRMYWFAEVKVSLTYRGHRFKLTLYPALEEDGRVRIGVYARQQIVRSKLLRLWGRKHAALARDLNEQEWGDHVILWDLGRIAHDAPLESYFKKAEDWVICRLGRSDWKRCL